jgi:hypothetical protein
VVEVAVSGVVGARRIVEWAPEQTRKVMISGYEKNLQPMTVTSPMTGQPVDIQVMRLYLGEVDGVVGPFEWNVASKQCMEVLNAILARSDFDKLLLEVTKQGSAPKTKWIVRVV